MFSAKIGIPRQFAEFIILMTHNSCSFFVFFQDFTVEKKKNGKVRTFAIEKNRNSAVKFGNKKV